MNEECVGSTMGNKRIATAKHVVAAEVGTVPDTHLGQGHRGWPA